MKRVRVRLRDQSGQALVTGLLLVAGVLVPLLFVVPLFARVESTRLAAEQAARDAVRSAAKAPSRAAADVAARQALARANRGSGARLDIALSGRFARGEVLRAEVTARVPLADIGGGAGIGSVPIRATAHAPVDHYRSLLP
jgi:hypothetical protein